MPDRLPPLVPLPLPEPDRRALRRRAVATVRSAVRHLSGVVVRRVLRRPRPGQTVARSLRLTFETLGATYVKLGQLVASSPGVFGDAVANEFRSCLDTGPEGRLFMADASLLSDRAFLSTLLAEEGA